jgi:hypothetical protein
MVNGELSDWYSIHYSLLTIDHSPFTIHDSRLIKPGFCLWKFFPLASKPKTIDMKKNLFLATALLASGIALAQQKQKAPPPPPPPPPALEAKDIPPPPPPPPPAPEPPKLLMTKEYAAFLKRNKQVRQLQYTDDQKVTIHLKSGKSEEYDLDKKEDLKKLEDKYGQLPKAAEMPPPPPPPAPKKSLKQQS